MDINTYLYKNKLIIIFRIADILARQIVLIITLNALIGELCTVSILQSDIIDWFSDL